MKFLLLFFIAISGFAYSQKPQKQHFEIISSDSSVISRCTKALDKMYLDSLRFLDARRVIEFSNVPASAVLYSANEMWEKHQKKVSRYTIVNSATARKIKFQINKTSIKIIPE